MKKIIFTLMLIVSVLFMFACEPETHTHEYGSKWGSDKDSHWKTCTGADCNEQAEKGAHTWSEPVVTERRKGLTALAYIPAPYAAEQRPKQFPQFPTLTALARIGSPTPRATGSYANAARRRTQPSTLLTRVR